MLCLRTLTLLLLFTATLVLAISTDDLKLSLWTCGNHQGYCRRYCFTHESFVGAFGCPRKFRCCIPGT